MVSGKELIIVDARNAQDLSIVSRVGLEDRPIGMYLTGNRLTLVSSTESAANSMQSGVIRLWTDYRGYGDEWQRATTTVTVLDVADRAAPTQVQRTELHGALVSSRMAGGELRLIAHHLFCKSSSRATVHAMLSL